MYSKFIVALILIATAWGTAHFIGAQVSVNTASAETSIAKVKHSEEEIRSIMLSWSDQLGVTCNECHNVSNFKDTGKLNYKIAVEHAKAVELLRQNGFDGKKQREASCTMCHMGKLKPPMAPPTKKKD